jgi:phosphoribosylformylglycinamidine cyclo-ligase
MKKNESSSQRGWEALPSRYESLGVDVSKKGIEYLRAITDDLFPEAFCSVVRHPSDSKKGIILHEDGAGSKPLVSYLCYKETGDCKWFEPLAADVIAMNVDDVICVGGIPHAFSDYVALNGFMIDKEDLLVGLAGGFSRTFSNLLSAGTQILFSGGETADLPDIVRTFDVSGTVYAEVQLSKIVTSKNIAPGDLIVGLRSGGRSKYETKENSGLMCNGVTLARHSLLCPDYKQKYPEVGSERAKGYTGHFKLDSEPQELDVTVAEALLSPSRIFLPVALEVLKNGKVNAMVHNTGGGLTKCKRLGRNIRFVKDKLPKADPIFELIQGESTEEWRDMYREFNMGIGFEFIVPKGEVEPVLKASKKYGIEARVIGYCEKSPSGNSVLIKSEHGKFDY